VSLKTITGTDSVKTTTLGRLERPNCFAPPTQSMKISKRDHGQWHPQHDEMRTRGHFLVEKIRQQDTATKKIVKTKLMTKLF
jgi:hypothetical protein